MASAAAVDGRSGVCSGGRKSSGCSRRPPCRRYNRRCARQPLQPPPLLPPIHTPPLAPLQALQPAPASPGRAARGGPCASQRRDGPGASPAPASPGRGGRERPGLVQNSPSGVIWAGKYTGNRAQVTPEFQFWDLMQIYIFEYKFA